MSCKVADATLCTTRSTRERSGEVPLLGRRMVLTIEDLPELERRLRLSGWKVERRGDELICWTGKKPRIQ